METNKEKEHGESWPDFSGLWNITFNFSSLFDTIRMYLEKRKLRKILKNRNEITRARNIRNKF